MALPNAEKLIGRLDLLPPGTAVLCAVSGGADSMCLLHFLSRREGLRLVCAHFDHQLRGAQSDADAAFVRGICDAWGIPFALGRGDVAAFARREGLSIEEAARILRYAFLEEAADAEGCQVIATAHTADDNAETVLLNLIRGTALTGLGGIRPVRGRIVRPLLTTSRSEVLAYLSAQGVPHVEDLSNENEDFARNKVRRRIVPLLREIDPRASEHIAAAAEKLAQADRHLEGEAQDALTGLVTGPGRAALPWQALQRAPEALRGRMLLLLLDRLGVGRKDFGAVHLDAVLDLKQGGSLDLPHGVTARRAGEDLILALRPGPLPEAPLAPGVPLTWGDHVLTLRDAPRGEGLALTVPAGARLTVGPCPPSGRLTLPGSSGARTVKRLCLDKGIGLSRRERLPAFYVDGALAAVWPLGADAAFAAEGENGWFIQIESTEKD